MDAIRKENALLRRGLVNAWGAASSVRKEFTAYVNKTQVQLAARDSEITTLKDENANLRSIVQQQAKELAYHENYNNSSRDARLYARRRRRFHDDVASAQGEWMSPKRGGESPAEGVDTTVQGVAADAGAGQAAAGIDTTVQGVAADAGAGQAASAPAASCPAPASAATP